MFDSICDAVLSDGKLYFSSPAAKVTNEHYDPDKEQYLATVIYGDDTYKGKISVVCSISPDKARWYKIGTITKMRVDGKWLVPAESEYEVILVDIGKVFCKTTFATSAKTVPLRICFKDIKFNYSNISDELKNHCFTSEEYNAKLRTYYDTLYHYKEIFRKDLEKLKSDYSIYSNNGMSGRFNNFEEWFSDRIYHSDYKHYLDVYNKDVYNVLNSGYKNSKQSYYELREYEGTLACIQAILDETKEEMKESLSNIEITNNLDKYINASENSPVINKVIIDGNQITFVISKKEQVQGVFNNKLKNSLGKPYKGIYDKSLCTNDEKLILCEKSSGYYRGDQIFLIVNNKETYKLSPKAAQQLYVQGFFR